MTDRSYKPDRPDADAVRERYSLGGDDDRTAREEEEDEKEPTTFTGAGETPDVLSAALESGDPERLAALSQRAEEVADVAVAEGHAATLATEVPPDEQEAATGTPAHEALEMIDAESSAEEATERARAASENPVVSESEIRFETSRYFNVLEERLETITVTVGAGDDAIEIAAGNWSIAREDEEGRLLADATLGRLHRKRRVRLHVEVHPDPTDCAGGRAIIGHDSDLAESITELLRFESGFDYYIAVIAVPVSLDELPETVRERCQTFVDSDASLLLVGLADGTVECNDQEDHTAARVRERDVLSPKTHEAAVTQIADDLLAEMESGDERTAEEVAAAYGVSERIATRAFGKVAADDADLAVLTEKVPQPILVRW